jgi:hypothetical protein
VSPVEIVRDICERVARAWWSIVDDPRSRKSKAESVVFTDHVQIKRIVGFESVCIEPRGQPICSFTRGAG